MRREVDYMEKKKREGNLASLLVKREPEKESNCDPDDET